MHRSFVAKTWFDALLDNPQHLLPDDVVARFFSVVRIGPHEEIAVFDGEGREAIGALKKTAHGACFAHMRVRNEERPRPAITLLQSALEESKLAQTIQRGVEFGVDRFIIFPSKRSEPFCFGKISKKLDRLTRITQDAARQSMRLYVPAITLLPSFESAIAECKGGFAMFGDVNGSEKLSRLLHEKAEGVDAFFIAVGPEGGFSPDENTRLQQAGFHNVQWAPYVLRSELACLSAVSIINAYSGRA